MVMPVAIYLPQFHSIPENDAWWGEGFTEWTRVDAARPLFPGHAQPLVPAPPLGHYDLLDRATRLAQGQMARAHGIEAFCYYHYWFRGKRLLEAPLERMLADGAPDLPFMLAWANEPWTRRWDGHDEAVLQAQEYGDEADWRAHFALLLRFFRDPRYVRVQGRPIVLIYRVDHVPCLDAMLRVWRQCAREADLPGVHVVAMLGSFPCPPEAMALVDGAAEFLPSWPRRLGLAGVHMRGVRVASARQAWRIAQSAPREHAVQYPGAFASWDNTARTGARGIVFEPLDVETFRALLQTQMQRAATDPALPAPLVFINAWNEWAEGCHLEPDARHGMQRLEAVRDARAALETGALAAEATPKAAPQTTEAPPASPPQPAAVVRVDDDGATFSARLPAPCVGHRAQRRFRGHPDTRVRALEAELLVLGTLDAELLDVARLRQRASRPTWIDENAVLCRHSDAVPLPPAMRRLRLDLLRLASPFAQPLGESETVPMDLVDAPEAMRALRAAADGAPTVGTVLALLELTATHPGWIAPLRQAARGLNDLGEPAEAAQVLRRALETAPGDGECLCEQARCLDLAGQGEAALAQRIATLTDAPWHLGGWHPLMQQLGALREARTCALAETFIEAWPHNYVLGALAAGACPPAAGGRLLRRVIGALASTLSSDETHEAAEAVGKILQSLGAAWLASDGAGVDAVREASALFPSSLLLADLTGQTLWRTGARHEALEALERAGRLHRALQTWLSERR